MSDRMVICVLGWHSGDRDRLARTAEGGRSGAPRRRLRTEDLVPLAAVSGEDALAAYPIAVVDEALRSRTERSTT